MNDEIWKVNIEEYRKSGLSQRVWCKNKEYKVSTLRYWINKFNKNIVLDTPESNAIVMATVKVSSTDTNVSPIVIETPTGLKVHISENFDEELLVKVINIAKRV
jgi:hypothetical protein